MAATTTTKCDYSIQPCFCYFQLDFQIASNEKRPSMNIISKACYRIYIRFLYKTLLSANNSLNNNGTFYMKRNGDDVVTFGPNFSSPYQLLILV